MNRNPRGHLEADDLALRREGGRWLRELREAAGLSQRELADVLGVVNYAFVAQLEAGRTQLPPEAYKAMAQALGLAPADFVRELMRFYDPVTHKILFGARAPEDAIFGRAQQARPQR